ncbi:MAG: hypothetical protein RLZZ383_2016 [Pseudomonadota bacterium]
MSPAASKAAVVASWTLFALAEVGFVLRGGRWPTPEGAALEAVLLVGLVFAQLRWLPEGVARSPAWTLVGPVGWTAVALGPTGWAAAPHAVGVAALAVVAARGLDAVAGRAALAVVAPLLGAVAVRAQVWAWSPGVTERVTSVQGTTWRRTLDELRPREATRTPEASGPPIVLITVDTLRADAAASMASLGRVASAGRRFETALSTSSWTVPSMASVMTGHLPATHGAGVSNAGALAGIAPTVPTLAESLSANGYATAAFATNAWLKPGLGFERGFDAYDHADLRRPHRLLAAGFPPGRAPRDAMEVVARALDWAGAQGDGRGRFLWVHLLDPHLPWLHDASGAGWSDERLRSGMRLDEDVERQLRAGYAAEVAHVDAAITALLDGLEAAGWGAPVVALTADHGEEWWDHGGTGHGHQHHAEVVRVPMALMGPGVAPGVEAAPVQLADLGTTLAALAGVSLGDGARIDAAVPMDRVVTTAGNAYFHQERSAWGQGWHVLGRLDGAPRCYALATDPTEQQPTPCAAGAPLAAWEAVRLGAGAKADVDREALRALGYVE